MSHEEFRQLLKRYVQGTCTPEERERVARWYNMLPDKQSMPLTEEQYDVMEERLWQRVCRQTEENPPRTLLLKNTKQRWWTSAAAAVLLLMLLFTWFTPQPSVQWVHNPDADTLRVDLPDGSVVQLMRGGQLSYSMSSSNRDLTLKGSALFDVASDSLRPFSIAHGKMMTQVLGTEFLIADSGADESEVIVYSGKVLVKQACSDAPLIKKVFTKPKSVQLSSNERALINTKRETLEATIVARPMPVVPNPKLLQSIRFEAVQLGRLAHKLSKIYALDIQVVSKHANTTFTGNLDNMSLFEQLDLICAVTATQYLVQDRKISIQ